VLALNSGSSSLKFGLYAVSRQAARMILSGEAQFGDRVGKFWAEGADGEPLDIDPSPVADETSAVRRIGELLARRQAPAPEALGFRIVHGGPGLREHCLLDAAVLARLERAVAFAPVHIPPALRLVRASDARFPGLPRAACFDTAFHAHMPSVAKTLPLPKALMAEGVQRYGFHGLSCESITRQLGDNLPRRLIIAHLGNGASITAVRDGTSVDTSMGMTPTGGVIMGTRAGDLDPGVLVHLMREKAMDPDAVEALVDHRSGLLGISGLSGDMRDLQGAAASDADARLAIAMFAYSVRKQIAAMIAVLGGVDMIVFTGGIGENDAPVRAAIVEGLACFGISLDDRTSSCAVRVLPSREDEQIALHTGELVRGEGA
jgi:acetate kinase